MEIQATVFYEITPAEIASTLIKAKPHNFGVVIGKVFNAMECDAELDFNIKQALRKDNRAKRAIDTLYGYINEVN